MARATKGSLAPERMSDGALWSLAEKELRALAPEARVQLSYRDENRSIRFVTLAVGELHRRGQQLQADVARAGYVDGQVAREGPASELTM